MRVDIGESVAVSNERTHWCHEGMVYDRREVKKHELEDCDQLIRQEVDPEKEQGRPMLGCRASDVHQQNQSS